VNRRHVKKLIREALSKCELRVTIDSDNDIQIEIELDDEVLMSSNYCSLEELANE
jgi:hypothetical protein